VVDPIVIQQRIRVVRFLLACDEVIHIDVARQHRARLHRAEIQLVALAAAVVVEAGNAGIHTVDQQPELLIEGGVGCRIVMATRSPVLVAVKV